MTIKRFNDISSIIGKYDSFIIDLWGVIHDGQEAYLGVHECLVNMKEAGKNIVFLSNAPRRVSRAVEGLERVGVTDDMYDDIVTSGEVTYDYIKLGKHSLGKKYYIIGPERDAGLLDGLDYQRIESIADADFAIVTGFDGDDSVLEDKAFELSECLKYKLPMICANPDLVVVRQSGVRALCAGVIANEYERMGGNVTQFGKPYESVYEYAFNLLHEVGGYKADRVAAIGDNLVTDIRGANNVNIDSYLIAGGILGEELGITHGQLPDADKLQKKCEDVGDIPMAVLPAFIWT